MPTFLQLKKTRPARKKKTRVRQLRECPQKRGVCHKLFIMTPRKPNSAKRRVAKIKLCTKKFVFGYIPGEGNNLQKYSHVLIRGGLIRDLPGVHYTIIRGKLDLHSILYRRQGRSKYGTKIWWTPKKKERMSAQAVYKKTILEQIQGYLIYNNTRYSRLCLAQACKRLALDFLLTAPNGIVQARYVNDIQTLFARRIVEIHESLQQAHLRYLVKNNLINQQILKNPKEQYLFFLKLRTTPQHLLIPPKKVFPDSKQKKNFGASLNSAQNIQKTKHHASFQGTTSKRNFCTYSNGQLKKANCFLAFTKQFSSVISFKANNFVFFSSCKSNYLKSFSPPVSPTTFVKKKKLLLYHNLINRSGFLPKIVDFLNMKIFVTYFNFKKQAKNFFQKIIKFKNPKAYVLEQNQRDFFFNQKYFAKFNNIFLTQGRKSKSQHFLNRLHFSTKNALHLSLIFIIFRIIEKLKMQVELLPFRQSGRLIYIPTILPFLRQKTNILKLLKKSFLSRQEVTLIEKLIGEISDLLLGNKCIMVQKVNKLYEIAIYSQPNMHFRWSHK